MRDGRPCCAALWVIDGAIVVRYTGRNGPPSRGARNGLPRIVGICAFAGGLRSRLAWISRVEGDIEHARCRRAAQARGIADVGKVRILKDERQDAILKCVRSAHDSSPSKASATPCSMYFCALASDISRTTPFTQRSSL